MQAICGRDGAYCLSWTAILSITTASALCLSAAEGAAQDIDESTFLGTVVLGTALRDARSAEGTPVSVDVVTSEEIERKQPNDLGDLLETVPGVSVSGGPRAISQTPIIRGFSDDQLVFRLDGGRLNFNQAHRGRSFFDPALVKQVEVVRGGGSTLYGSGALGGVIAVETVDAADLLQEGQTAGARLRFGYESNGDKFYSNITTYADWGNADALLSLSHRDTSALIEQGGGTDTPLSTLEQLNGLLKFGYEPSEDMRIELSFASYDDQGLTTANSSSNPSTSNPTVDRNADTRDIRLRFDYDPVDNDQIDLSVLFYDHRLQIVETDIANGDVDDTTYDTTGIEITNRSRFDIGVPVTLVYGVEYFQDTQRGLANGAPRVQYPSAKAETFGIFAEGTFEVSSATNVILGLRYDNYKRDPNDGSLATVEEDFFSPRIGISHKFNQDWEVYSNLSRAFRAPSLTELYNSGLHFAGVPAAPPFFPGFPDNLFVPNPNLRPEKSTQFEIGTRFDNGPLSFQASVFYADVDDYIDTVVNVFAGTTTQSNINAKLYGGEASVGYDAGAYFVSAGLTIVRGEEDGSGDNLGSLPQDRINATFGYRPNDAWTLGVNATFAAAQDRIPANGTASSGYGVVDLFATYAPDSGPLANAVIQMGIDNVFDKNYTVYPNALAQPGRNFKVNASFTF